MTKTLDRPAVLTTNDRCDHRECGTQAWVRAHWGASVLDFCRRHFNAVEEVVTATATSITDERDRCT